MPDPRPTMPDQHLDVALAYYRDRCWTCRGTGHISLGYGRNDSRTCSMCRGSGQRAKR